MALHNAVGGCAALTHNSRSPANLLIPCSVPQSIGDAWAVVHCLRPNTMQEVGAQ